MLHSFSEPRVVIRPALPLDREAVLEFCKFIWDGHDYIPDVWDDWMADPSGEMFVAEYAGRRSAWAVSPCSRQASIGWKACAWTRSTRVAGLALR
jgi:hypothetical protein